MIIAITHQIDKTIHRFKVKDENKLTAKEVNIICEKMNVTALFIKGKYYEYKN
jgi:hypothetical protein